MAEIAITIPTVSLPRGSILEFQIKTNLIPNNANKPGTSVIYSSVYMAMNMYKCYKFVKVGIKGKRKNTLIMKLFKSL